MLKKELIELINHGNVWAFIGSGVSADSGLPDWKNLLLMTIDKMELSLKHEIFKDELYLRDFANKDYPSCFSILEKKIGRKPLLEIIRNIIKVPLRESDLVKIIVDLPFQGYITTNYDLVLENALSRESGWISVGNSEDEIKKISGNPSKMIWHIHGAIDQSEELSKLVITSEDYEYFYLEGSRMVNQLRALMTQKRTVIIGFGLQDYEINRLLKIIGKYTIKSKPIFAFLSSDGSKEDEKTKDDYLRKYNVDVIPYEINKGSHKQLTELLKVHGSFTLRRSMKFSTAYKGDISYDPAVTGLLLYNEVCLKENALINDKMLKILIRSRILSLVKHAKKIPLSKLLEDVKEKINTIRGIKSDFDVLLIDSLRDLQIEKLIIPLTNYDPTQIIELSATGDLQVGEKSTSGEVLYQKFLSSIKSRIGEILNVEAEIEKVLKVAVAFLTESIEKRSLGVALALNNRNQALNDYHIVALLQSLPKYMDYLENNTQAICLSKVVQSIFSTPTSEESKYIGLLLQAKFGVHLLGFDQDTLSLRQKEFSQSVFLIDASTLIPFLAKSSVGFDSAVALINLLLKNKSIILTTKLLAAEVSEHGRWAEKKFEESKGAFNIEILKAVVGKSGTKSNAFIEGFINEYEKGIIPEDFSKYVEKVCPHTSSNRAFNDSNVQNEINNRKIFVKDPDELEGFLPEHYAEIDNYEKEIKSKREAKLSFTHDRQVKAEAQALLIIEKIREGVLKYAGNIFSNAYFVSHTRIIDFISHSSIPITMRPESLYQWLLSTEPCNIEEYSYLTNSLIRELVEKNCDIIDEKKIHTIFAPIIDTSKDKCELILTEHRDLIGERFGEDPLKAFNETEDIYKPIVFDMYQKQALELMREKYEEAERKLVLAQDKLKSTDLDSKRLQKLDDKKRKNERKQKGKISKSNRGKGKNRKK
ncbi:MAG: SIR2 family protein [Ignavibacteria bacterium]